MNDGLRSILLGTAALWAALAVAVVITFARAAPSRDPVPRDRLHQLLLLGVVAQCAHVIEELVTGFHVSWPRVLGLVPWSAEFFVAFNIAWIAIWVLSAVALREGMTWALVPIWFFTLGMTMNGVAHPLLALQSGGYFPGLASSPVVGIFGVVLWSRLLALTRREGTGLRG